MSMADAIELTLPVKLVSEANSHTHWRNRQMRAKGHRSTARNVLLTVFPASPMWGEVANGCSLRVTLTRIAPRSLDCDNLAGSGKHVRDGVADALGIDDRDPRVKWLYAQRKGKPNEYACHVLIEVAE